MFALPLGKSALHSLANLGGQRHKLSQKEESASHPPPTLLVGASEVCPINSYEMWSNEIVNINNILLAEGNCKEKHIDYANNGGFFIMYEQR